MNRFGWELCVSVFLFCSSVAFLGLVIEPSKKGETIDVHVDRVIDGDTVVVRSETESRRVRLEGVDAPEMKQAGGVDSREWLLKEIGDKDIRLVVKAMDRYGRTVGDLVLIDGKRVNEKIVRAGWAWWYRQYDRSDWELMEAESEARAARVGLWLDPNPVPPWVFRRMRKPH